MKILCVVGARPNFIKMAPLWQSLQKHESIQPKLVHTGQHADEAMSRIFFDQLPLPTPDYFLTTGSGTINQQTAVILQQFADVLHQEQPGWVLVVGDVTSTLACALAAAQQGIPVAHVEAGLRSGDPTMPEERNRRVTDALSSLLFVTEPVGLINLSREGIAATKIHFVGNVLIDALTQYRTIASHLNRVEALGLKPKMYALLTIHRPVNVDTERALQTFLQVLEQLATILTVVLPLHPRTRTNFHHFGLWTRLLTIPNVRLLAPQDYLAFLNLMDQAAVVITDSGGVQEETTYLQVPCLTFRHTTERPITVELGTNQLIADLSPEQIKQRVAAIVAGQPKPGQIPPLWDGRAAERIAQILADKMVSEQ